MIARKVRVRKSIEQSYVLKLILRNNNDVRTNYYVSTSKSYLPMNHSKLRPNNYDQSSGST